MNDDLNTPGDPTPAEAPVQQPATAPEGEQAPAVDANKFAPETSNS